MASTLSYIMRFLDTIFGIGASMAIIDTFKYMNGADPVFTFVEKVDITVRIVFGIVAVVYGIARVYHFWHDSKINRQIKREELKKMIRSNTE